jgi:hypothetical protein
MMKENFDEYDLIIVGLYIAFFITVSLTKKLIDYVYDKKVKENYEE